MDNIKKEGQQQMKNDKTTDEQTEAGIETVDATDSSAVEEAKAAMEQVIERLRRGSLEACVEDQTIRALACIKHFSQSDYEVQRMRLRQANPRISVERVERLVKQYESTQSGPQTHHTYARAILQRLTFDGHAPVAFEACLYSLNPAAKLWGRTERADLLALVAELFDGSPHCVKAADYSAIAQLAVDLAESRAFFMDAPDGLAVHDTFYMVEGKELRMEPLAPRHRQRVSLGFSPTAMSTPLFDAFLEETFKSEREGEAQQQIRLLQEIAGAIMMGIAHRYHKAALFFDPFGRAGKGTMERVLRHLVPEGHVSALSPVKWGNEYYMADLARSRLNVVGELPENQRIPAEHFKSVLGGDPLTGRHPHGRPFVFKSQAAHLFMSNSLPAATEHTDALFNRWLIVEFPNSRTRSGLPLDTSLASRIVQSEMPGIAHWALQGAQRVLAQDGYSPSLVHDRLIDEARLGNSSAEAFIREACSLGGDDIHVRCSRLYTAYKSWCHEGGHVPLGRGKFRTTLLRSTRLRIVATVLDGYDIYRGVAIKDVDIDTDF